MKYQDPTTTNLADFCARERGLLIDLLTAWEKHGLPDDFDDDGVHPMFNRNSGCVFLTNSNYDVCMMNGPDLETWHHCGNCGHEGFLEDCKLNRNGCNACCPCTPEERGE